MSRYLVTTPDGYRGHDWGKEFSANLDPAAEARAIARGDIVVIDPTPVKLDPRRVTPPQP